MLLSKPHLFVRHSPSCCQCVCVCVRAHTCLFMYTYLISFD